MGGNRKRMMIELEVAVYSSRDPVTGSTQASWGIELIHSLINSVSKCFGST